jgi:hypothetical protein
MLETSDPSLDWVKLYALLNRDTIRRMVIVP